MMHTGMLDVSGIVRRAGIDGRVVGTGVMAHVHLDDRARLEEARAALDGSEYYDVIDPADPPPGIDLAPSPRIGDLVIVAHPG
jgi:hypothetical protein